jgi:hypothetical protein
MVALQLSKIIWGMYHSNFTILEPGYAVISHLEVLRSNDTGQTSW